MPKIMGDEPVVEIVVAVLEVGTDSMVELDIAEPHRVSFLVRLKPFVQLRADFLPTFGMP